MRAALAKLTMTRRRLRPLAVVAALGVALAVPAAGNRDAEQNVADAGPEPLLASILYEVRHQRLEAALTLAERLTSEFPTFRLGHLIHGDLLLARSRPIRALGNTDINESRVAALRDEADKRLAAYARKPDAERLPRQVLKLAEAQKRAILVDTRASRLYVLANDGPLPRVMADYYVSQGRGGAAKQREGDLKTPVGVYHVTEFLPPEKLTDFYGSGAFPINYPNDRDRRLGRTGHGIWLHGTPPDAYARAPKASEGCVVLANPDFESLATSIEAGTTPVVIADGVDWMPIAQWLEERDSLRATIEAWRRDWESRNVGSYLGHYAADFVADGQDRASFAAGKRAVNEGKSWIEVVIDDLQLFTDPGAEGLVVATFRQDYRSNNMTNTMRKVQHWTRRKGRWQIVYEGSA